MSFIFFINFSIHISLAKINPQQENIGTVKSFCKALCKTCGTYVSINANFITYYNY